MATSEEQWWVYMILTSRNSLYTGISRDPQRRFAEHSDMYCGRPNAKGAKYFRSVEPVALVYTEEHTGRASASRREIQIKKLTKTQKCALIAQSGQLKQI